MDNCINVKIIENSNTILEVLPYATSLVCALIAGFVSWFVSHKQAKNAIKELDEKYKLDFDQYQKQDLYEMRKIIIFKALNLFDDYISWLKVDGNTPIRKQESNETELTLRAREVYNELCVTVNNKKLITLFNEILFNPNNDDYYLGKLAEFRKEARKELELSKIDYPKDVAFILRVSTEDLAKQSKYI